MRAGTRPRYLKPSWHTQRPSSLDIVQRIQQRGRAVEISRQPPAVVTIQQRVQANMHLSGQVGSQHFGGQREIITLRVRDFLAPAAAYCWKPPRPSGAGILPSDSINVGACSEQSTEESHPRPAAEPPCTGPGGASKNPP